MLFEMESSLNLIGNNFKCEICEKTFQNNRNIKRHITSAHGEGKTFPCNVCTRISRTKRGLHFHIQNYHQQNKRYFKCDYCEKSFNLSGHLMTHIKRIHEPQKNSKCDYCGKSFTTSDYLKIHISTIHEAQRNYKCSFGSCGKSFTT